MISGARWHSQPLWMRSLSSRLESRAQSESYVAGREGQAPARSQAPVPSLLASCISLWGHCLTLDLRLRPCGSGTGKAGLERDTPPPNHRGVPSPLRRPSPAAFHKYSRLITCGSCSVVSTHVYQRIRHWCSWEVRTDTRMCVCTHTSHIHHLKSQTTRPGPFCFLYFAQEKLRLRVLSACPGLPLYPLPAGPRAGAPCAAWQAPTNSTPWSPPHGAGATGKSGPLFGLSGEQACHMTPILPHPDTRLCSLTRSPAESRTHGALSSWSPNFGRKRR